MTIQPSAFSLQPSIWAIIPVKPLRQSKRRLAHILSAEARADLIHHFLSHTLAVLHESDAIDRVLVVSSDERVLATARRHGAEVLVETAVHGLNPAVTQAVQYAADKGATAVLILPADLPFIEKQDVAIMVGERKKSPHIAICSDDQGTGTNALLLSPPGDFTFCYGPDSYQRHLQEAIQRRRAVYTIQDKTNLQFDLDTEADWQKYQFITNNEQLTIDY